jgi:GPI mannosyltransferase 3
MNPEDARYLSKRKDLRALGSIFLLAFAVRLCIVPIIGIHHPDELWQYLEPAYKLVTGRWVEAWDFRHGIRSWLVPIAIAPAVWAGHAVDPYGLAHVYLPRVEMALLSLTIVWSAWKLGSRLSRSHAIMAAFVAAVWVEFVHFAPRTLSEPISVALIFPAFVLLAEDDRRKLLFSGLLLGLAVAVRLQYAPAVACLALGGLWGRWRLVPWVVAGGVGGLAMDGLANLLAGATPFYWMIENFNLNVVQSKSAEFGVAPWYQYPFVLLYRWNFMSGAIIVLAGLGARRFPVLAATAIVNILVHSFIPHKEYRFIFLSSACLVFLAAIGTTEALRFAGAYRSLATKAAFAIWLLGSGALAMIQPTKGDWTGSDDLLNSLRLAGSLPKVCGLATYQLDQPLSVAYTFYNRGTPIFGFKGPTARNDFLASKTGFNVVLTNRIWSAQIGNDYRLEHCTKRNPFFLPFCVYRREGSCFGPPDNRSEINQLLIRYGK